MSTKRNIIGTVVKIFNPPLFLFEEDLNNSDIIPFEHNISEGLILTYDAKSCESYLKKRFTNIVCVTNYDSCTTAGVPKEVCGELGRGFVNGMKIQFAVLIDAPFDNISDINKVVSDLCGWSPYVVRLEYKDPQKNNIPVFTYCPYRLFSSIVQKSNKYTDADALEIERVLKDYNTDRIEIYYLAKHCVGGIAHGELQSKYCYHTTYFSKLERISKQGLCPRHNDNDEIYLDRIYFTPDIGLIIKLVNDDNKKFNILFRFNGDILKENCVSYDKKHKESYYTTQNISPDDIEVYTEYGWKPVKDSVDLNLLTIDEIEKEIKKK